MDQREFSNGIVRNETEFVCKEGFSMNNGQESASVECSSGQWLTTEEGNSPRFTNIVLDFFLSTA